MQDVICVDLLLRLINQFHNWNYYIHRIIFDVQLVRGSQWIFQGLSYHILINDFNVWRYYAVLFVEYVAKVFFDFWNITANNLKRSQNYFKQSQNRHENVSKSIVWKS